MDGLACQSSARCRAFFVSTVHILDTAPASISASAKFSHRRVARWKSATWLMRSTKASCSLGQLLLTGKDGELNEDQRQMITMMTAAAAGMHRLVTSMLEFAQVGQGALRLEAIHVESVIKEVEVWLTDAIRESAARIDSGPLPTIEGDRTQVARLFQNLIGNAIKYRKPSEAPVILVSAEDGGHEWILAVQDNGQGIPRQSLEQIFHPLKRLHGDDVPGTGLGLAFCRRIVQRHGGRIWAESPGTGQGTTIRFTFTRA